MNQGRNGGEVHAQSSEALSPFPEGVAPEPVPEGREVCKLETGRAVPGMSKGIEVINNMIFGRRSRVGTSGRWG